MDLGAAVWGPMVAQAGGVTEAEDRCLQFLRLTFGVKYFAVGVGLLREVGCQPTAGPQCGRLGYAVPRVFRIGWSRGGKGTWCAQPWWRVAR